MGVLLQVLLALAVLAGLEALYYVIRAVRQSRRTELRRRLQSLGRENASGSILLRAGKLSSIGFINEILKPIPTARAIERLLEQADLGLTVAQFLVYSLLLGGIAAAGSVIGNLGIGLVILFGLAGLLVPLGVVLSVRSTRSEKISEQLPEALEMMSRSLRAGHALESAFQLVATEAPAPVNVEFGRAYEEQRLGRNLEQSVIGITHRVPNNQDLDIFAVSVTVQKETGGNLAEILENIAETIRQRYRFYGKLRSLTAEGKVSGMILGSLPLVVLVLLSVMNWSYIRVLFETRDGHFVLLGAAVIWIVGLVWLFRLAKVEY